MKKELQDKLFNHYPKLFKDKDKSPKETLICFGIECDDGWYWLINNLCKCIQTYIDNNKKVTQIKVVQVKEKFGELRFYTDYSDDFIDGIIHFAEVLSNNICEVCGENIHNISKGHYDGWIKTICDSCYEKWANERKK